MDQDCLLSLVWHSLEMGCRAISDLNFGFVRFLLLFSFSDEKTIVYSIQSLFKHNPNVNYIINATAAPKGPKRELMGS